MTATISPTMTTTPEPDYDMTVAVYNSAGEIVKVLAETGAYHIIEDFEIEHDVFSPDLGEDAVITVEGNIYTWDGTNNQGVITENGIYYVKVITQDKFGNQHVAVKDVTLLTNSITLEFRIYNSAGEVVKIIPVNGVSQADLENGTLDLTINHPFLAGSPTGTSDENNVFTPGDTAGSEEYIEINFMSGRPPVIWNGTNNQNLIVENGVYTMQMVMVDANGYESIAQAQLTVLHNGYEVINNLKITPNPINALLTEQVVFTFDVQSNIEIKVKIYNIAGELIKQIEDRDVTSIVWNMAEFGVQYASGVYIVVIEAVTDSGMQKTIIGKFVIVRK